MIATVTREAVAAYYAADRGDAEKAIAAFAESRRSFIADDIEWVESFGTLHGADEVQSQLIATHNRLLRHQDWTIQACYPTVGSDSIWVIGRFAAVLPNDACIDVWVGQRVGLHR